MKIASHAFATMMARSVIQNQAEHSAEQIRIASGKAYSRRSEACTRASEAAGLQQTHALSQQFQDNIGRIEAWTTVTESRLTGIVDIATRAREVAISGGDPTLSQAARDALGGELNSLLEDLLSQANATHDGVFLFGGTNGAQTPVSATRGPDDRVVAVTYATGAGVPRSAQLDAATTVTYGCTATGPGSPFADAAEGRDLFQAILDARDELDAGHPVSEGTMTALTRAFDGVTEQVVNAGMQLRRFEAMGTSAQDLAAVRQTRISELADADLAAAITRLSELQVSLQAAMQMAASVGNLSLTTYI